MLFFRIRSKHPGSIHHGCVTWLCESGLKASLSDGGLVVDLDSAAMKVEAQRMQLHKPTIHGYSISYNSELTNLFESDSFSVQESEQIIASFLSTHVVSAKHNTAATPEFIKQLRHAQRANRRITMLSFLEHLELFDEATAVHTKSSTLALLRATLTGMLTLQLPVSQLREYYGESVAFYFGKS